MPKIGRNELCSCGSGKKFKKCHGAKRPDHQKSLILMVVVGAAVLAALVVVAVSLTSERRGTRVWSPEHGHYHNEYGREIP